MTRRFVITVLVAGIAIGCGAALLGDRVPARSVPTVGAADTAPAQRVPLPPHGPVKIAARAADPGGGAAWAVRRFVTRQREATFACLQLGRLDGTRFGWIAPGRPFRLARFDQVDIPTSCGGKFHAGMPSLSVATLTTDASNGLPQPDRTIIWGALPPRAASARLSDGTRLDRGADGVVLVVLPGRPLGTPRLTGTLRLTSGASRRFAYPRPGVFPPRTLRGRDGKVRPVPPRGGSPLRDRARVAVRAPDPAGGAAWGIVTAPSTRGGTCRSAPARIVGNRPASVNPRLGLATPDPFADLQCSDRRPPSAAHPLRMDVHLTSIPQEDPTGTVQLRRLNDRTVLHGRTTADVRAVTITTSRDIRTLVPDPRTHTVLAVYDGRLPGEQVKTTATLRNGRRVTVLQSSGG
ncbi:MAG: hypothetical protein Q8K79_08805 [Solirubrobacteraceae bacterium]|nr:hypothetical protein [Solirubrobacteraceae bacterium]